MKLVTLHGNPVAHRDSSNCPCARCLSSRAMGKFSFHAPKFPKMKMRIKLPKPPRLRMKMPRVKMKVPAMHFGNIGSGFQKMTKGFISPFEKMGGSVTDLLTGTMDSATGLVGNVAQAAGDMAPDLLQKGLAAGADMLVPGSGGLVSSLLNSPSKDDTSSDTENPQNATQTALRPWSDAQAALNYHAASVAAQQASDIAAANEENPLKKYAVLAVGGLAIAYVMFGDKKGKR